MVSRIFDSALLELFDRRFESCEAAVGANPFRWGQDYFLWSRVEPPIARFISPSGFLDTTSALFSPVYRAEVRVVDRVYTRINPLSWSREVLGREVDFYVWCPTDSRTIEALLDVFAARLRWHFSGLDNPLSQFNLKEHYGGCWEPGSVAPAIEHRVQDLIETRYPHLINWAGRRTRTQQERYEAEQRANQALDRSRSPFWERLFVGTQHFDHDPMQAILDQHDREIAELERLKQARRQQIEQWCQENGYTDLFQQENKYWAFPPNGVMPIEINQKLMRGNPEP